MRKHSARAVNAQTWLNCNHPALQTYFLLYTSQKNGTINENQPAKEVMVTDGR